MEGYILLYTRADMKAPGGELHTQYIAVAETKEAAFNAAGGDRGIKQIVFDWGPHVLKRARDMGVGDNEAKPL